MVDPIGVITVKAIEMVVVVVVAIVHMILSSDAALSRMDPVAVDHVVTTDIDPSLVLHHLKNLASCTFKSPIIELFET